MLPLDAEQLQVPLSPRRRNVPPLQTIHAAESTRQRRGCAQFFRMVRRSSALSLWKRVRVRGAQRAALDVSR
jgi:hypothetical protein